MMTGSLHTFKDITRDSVAVVRHRQKVGAQQSAVLLSYGGCQSSLLDDFLDVDKDLAGFSTQQALPA